MLQDGFFRPDGEVVVRRGDLPHWRQDGALYFVTFRLSDSLPGELLDRWRRQRDRWLELHPNPTPCQLEDFVRMYRGRIEQWLDRGVGSCALGEEGAKKIVEGALRHFDGERYELGKFAVAGNHVHSTLRTLPGVDLTDVLQSWKGFTSWRIGRLPGFKARHPELCGCLWQHESFDHIVRSESDLERIHRYIENHEGKRE